jgi:hypothetical protein
MEYRIACGTTFMALGRLPNEARCPDPDISE